MQVSPSRFEGWGTEAQVMVRPKQYFPATQYSPVTQYFRGRSNTSYRSSSPKAQHREETHRSRDPCSGNWYSNGRALWLNAIVDATKSAFVLESDCTMHHALNHGGRKKDLDRQPNLWLTVATPLFVSGRPDDLLSVSQRTTAVDLLRILSPHQLDGIFRLHVCGKAKAQVRSVQSDIGMFDANEGCSTIET